MSWGPRESGDRPGRLVVRRTDRRADEIRLGECAHDFDLVVDDGLRDAGDAVLPREIVELGGLNGGGRDVRAGHRNAYRQTHRAGAVGAGWRHELLDAGR